MTGVSYRAWGLLFALAGVVGFSFRPILVKLCYAAHPVSPVTLLFLRMALSLPVFVVAAAGLEEPVTLLQVAGSILVISGVLLVSLQPKKS